ncbi:putative TetR family transcriptional regulator [Gordonia hirsuta DSM 44140 = NBRC 16056]|uniref:Putative TetR family transcriptional regulator n=1 Tax=Gordonia hirsuta DSM 44140 = NBRC 16056 TaxID=1121927 RepID=L7L6G3_9ACTN|nr:TetR/AcrR family transcriptional regulator [Gordonia hirsuta]GAC56346.1 putative TetR family transcriptional regulator [Gordonia hirsuta DSM 44140 = NBRC 16056]
MAAPRNRLSADDWVDAALTLITAEGVAGLKISRLCEVLEVTKGSFYWHFKDLDALWEAMAERWRTLNSARIGELHQLAELPPERRLLTLSTMLISEHHLTVETAIRDWARINEQVAETVRQIDSEVFNVVYATLSELEISNDQARLLAGLLVYAGIGFIHGHEGLPTPTPEELERALLGLLLPVTEQ